MLSSSEKLQLWIAGFGLVVTLGLMAQNQPILAFMILVLTLILVGLLIIQTDHQRPRARIQPQQLLQAVVPGTPLFLNPENLNDSYYVDVSLGRGTDVTRDMKEVMVRWFPSQSTCQLLSGYPGSGKSTELLRLKQQLEAEKYHVIYIPIDELIDLDDVEINDILMGLIGRVSQSLSKNSHLNLQPPREIQRLLWTLAGRLKDVDFSFAQQGTGKTTEQLYMIAQGIQAIANAAQINPKVRTQFRKALATQTDQLLDCFNQDILDPAIQQLKQQGQAGLVILVDNLDKVGRLPKPWGKPQPENLFIDHGDQLQGLHCHLVLTFPFGLWFSDEYLRLKQQYSIAPHILPLVAVEDRDGNLLPQNLQRLQQAVLARAFPHFSESQRLSSSGQIFDHLETLNQLCFFSGGRFTTLLRLFADLIRVERQFPLSRQSLNQVIQREQESQRRSLNHHRLHWLRQVAQNKNIGSFEGYRTVIRTLLVGQYLDQQGFWFDVNPILKQSQLERVDKPENLRNN